MCTCGYKKFRLCIIYNTYHQGFLLIELLSALALLTIMAMVLAQSITTMLALRTNSLKRLAALSLAQNYIEQWRIEKHVQKLESISENAWEQEQSVITIRANSISTQIAGFEMIQVTATWRSFYGHLETFELYAGKVTNT